ncbi:lasso peptide biosynthesis B2 protein [Streptomyces sp. SID1034]|uniref:lasso peptide biosynthesis B2 protein n=1 Tax=Streptomyces sp. SID1034 TaxID=2690248 RepID=UPI00136FE315|nr:lasso peptide biosynthesis B2 protein [Streptomyces sp. SID1034]
MAENHRRRDPGQGHRRPHRLLAQQGRRPRPGPHRPHRPRRRPRTRRPPSPRGLRRPARPHRNPVRHCCLRQFRPATGRARGLFAALLLLRLLPIRVAVAGARAATRLPGRAALPQEAEAAFAAVRRAARLWPGRAACLEESLAAHFAAAFTGRRVRWVVGARFVPQGAHAWIEAGTAIIGQDESDRVWPYFPALQVERSN